MKGIYVKQTHFVTGQFTLKMRVTLAPMIEREAQESKKM